MDAREEIKRWLALLVQLAGESESEAIKQDMDFLLGVAGELAAIIAQRNTALAKQCRPRSVKPPKSSPQKGPQQQNAKVRADSDDADDSSQDRSQGQSRIGQGIQKALNANAPTSQQQLRRQIYGAQNDDVAFRKAAKALAS